MEAKAAEGVCITGTQKTTDDSKTKVCDDGNEMQETPSVKEKESSAKDISDAGDAMDAGAHCSWAKRFTVWYLGSAIMHRLYTQSLQPWVMAEVKRKRDGIKEVRKNRQAN